MLWFSGMGAGLFLGHKSPPEMVPEEMLKGTGHSGLETPSCCREGLNFAFFAG